MDVPVMGSITIWFNAGGPFIVPLAILGVAGVLLLMERLVFIVFGSRIHARPFMERVISLARSGKVDEALKICTEHRSTLPDLGLVILRSRGHDETDLHNVVEAATLSMVPALTRRVAWLTTLAHLAILVGALGALSNLHDALSADGSAMAAAVVYAVRPLAVGLLFAIPLLAGHAYLAAEAEKVITQMEEFSARLVNALIDRPDVRLGHRE